MKPSIGRIVIVKSNQLMFNGSDEHPAIVNRTWGDGDPANGDRVLCNITALPDMGPPTCLGSVRLFETRQQAVVSFDAQPMTVCWWPEQSA